MNRRLLLVSCLFALACEAPKEARVFDGGPCTDYGVADDGGCEVKGDSCQQVVFDDPCQTQCTCGDDHAWSCARSCPPQDCCTVGGFCPQMTADCGFDDAGCALTCNTAWWGRVWSCAAACP